MAGIHDARPDSEVDPNVRAPRVTHTPQSRVGVRRSPKYGVFTALGVALGILAAVILATAFDGTTEQSPFTEVSYSQTQAFGFILLWCVPAGIALMMIVALILDRIASRHVRQATVTVDMVDEG
ncbi:potassium transporter Trk [Microbacterium excoecariae]|uniref:potassium transporter Trk n=1 Tax=Microbacterium excoecariae TaxID=2715210 RepID=UPI00140DFB28|nr:potassium transporter Trk [Microbacterium excoecariae]